MQNAIVVIGFGSLYICAAVPDPQYIRTCYVICVFACGSQLQ